MEEQKTGRLKEFGGMEDWKNGGVEGWQRGGAKIEEQKVHGGRK
jgi:hypothetical protein